MFGTWGLKHVVFPKNLHHGRTWRLARGDLIHLEEGYQVTTLGLQVGLVIGAEVMLERYFTIKISQNGHMNSLYFLINHPYFLGGFKKSAANSQCCRVPSASSQGKVWPSATTSIRVWRMCIFPEVSWTSIQLRLDVDEFWPKLAQHQQ